MIDIRNLKRAALAAAGLLLAATVPAWAWTIQLVNVSPKGRLANEDSFDLAGAPSDHRISADGRFVVFNSAASNMVPGDTNGKACSFPQCYDVFVRDRKLGRTERVDLGPHRVQAKGGDTGSIGPTITPDGRFVAFTSDATNLVSDDTKGHMDVFVRDRKLGRTERVSIGAGSVQGNDDSGFFGVTISADGRLVAFYSYATNLVPGDTGGGVYLRDRLRGRTERVDLGPGGVLPSNGSGAGAFPSISADRRFVAFESDADNLVPNDTNNQEDVFVRDLRTGTTERVSVGPHGKQQVTPPGEGGGACDYPSSISAHGRFVAFQSDAANLAPGVTGGTFVHDRATGRTRLVSADYGCEEPVSISANGRYVAFKSDIGPGFGGIFVGDLRTGRVEQVDLGPNGALPNGAGDNPSISADGRHVVFDSGATNLVPGVNNGFTNVFVSDRGPAGGP